MTDTAQAEAGRQASQRFGIRSRIIASGLLATALIVGCGGWAAQASLSGAIIAQGKITVEKQVKQIQHRDGGIVGAILVANGDVVKAGDMLVRLDDTQTKAELGDRPSQLSELIGRQARLQRRARRRRRRPVRRGLRGGGRDQAIAEGERRLFADNRATRDGPARPAAVRRSSSMASR